MSCDHLLVVLNPTAKVIVADGRNGKVTVNFGEVSSVNMTPAQAERTADALRAWIDERIAANPINLSQKV